MELNRRIEPSFYRSVVVRNIEPGGLELRGGIWQLANPLLS
jgi:hypothetical protein